MAYVGGVAFLTRLLFLAILCKISFDFFRVRMRSALLRSLVVASMRVLIPKF